MHTNILDCTTPIMSCVIIHFGSTTSVTALITNGPNFSPVRTIFSAISSSVTKLPRCSPTSPLLSPTASLSTDPTYGIRPPVPANDANIPNVLLPKRQQEPRLRYIRPTSRTFSISVRETRGVRLRQSPDARLRFHHTTAVHKRSCIQNQ